MKNFATSKTAFRKRLQGVNKAYYQGNDLWFDAAQYGQDPDQNLHVDFVWGGHRFYLLERIGYTNGGASWSSVTVYQYGTDKVVYSDCYHDGNGAWQTSDSEDARCSYTELTEYILQVFRGYVEQPLTAGV